MNTCKQIMEQLIFISIDSYKNKTFVGKLWLGNENKEIHFCNLMQLLLNIDEMLDTIDYPEETVKCKHFINPSARNASIADAPTLAHEAPCGALATFKLKVLFRQNASWQGTLTWLDNKQEQTFRSNLEMIMLMDSALSYADKSNST